MSTRKQHFWFNAALIILILLSPAVTLEVMAQSPKDQEVDKTKVEKAAAVQAKHEKALMGQPSVQGVGVGLLEDGKTVGIRIFVKEGAAATLPAHLDGIPVRVTESGDFVALNGPCDDPNFPCHTQTFPLPVPMGVSTSDVQTTKAGTLGYRVKRIGSSTIVGYITNNHVVSPPSSCVATAVFPGTSTFNRITLGLDQCQPGTLDATPAGTCTTPIGDLVQVVPLVMQGFYNTVDAAFVRSQRGCVSKNIRDIGAPTTTSAQFPVLGEVLTLSGRSSGLRTVQVMVVNMSLAIGYGCGNASFVNQSVIESVTGVVATLPGDSGAPVVKIRGTSIIPKGLVFAGSIDGSFGLINSMPLVLSALGVQIDTVADDPPAATCTSG